MIRVHRPVAIAVAVAVAVQAMAAASVLAAVLSPGPALVAGVLPVAVNDAGTVVHGRQRTVAAPGVLGNDLQIGSGFTAVLVSGVSNGSLNLDASGSYAYRSDLAFVGVDQFRYKVDGGLLGLSNIATVTITVTNQAPVASPDGYSAVAGVERSVAAPGVLGDDHDPDADDLTIDIVSRPANGTLNERPDGSFRYTANDGFAGADTFRYRASDGAAWSNTVTVEMTVTVPPTPTPTATPSPTPTRTATSTSTPTPSPGAMPSPTPRPTALPTGNPGSTSNSTQVPGPGSSTEAIARPGATAATSLTPDGSTPAPSTSPTAEAFATGDPSGAPIVSTGSGPGSGSDRDRDDPLAMSPLFDGDEFTVPDTKQGSDFAIDSRFVAFGTLEWAIPALVLTVPGLLLMLAILAQATIGVAFVPLARRWLGGDRRRQRGRVGGRASGNR